MTPNINYKSFTESDYKIQDGGQKGGRETLQLSVIQPLINMETTFFH